MPQIVYLPSSDGAGANMMKNWLSALFGSEARAIETTPRTCFSFGELGLELVARAAGAVALRVAGLRHEAVDHAMEDDAVIKALAHQRLDLRHRGRRQIGPHFDDDAAGRHVHVEGVFQICGHRLASEDERGDEHTATCSALP